MISALKCPTCGLRANDVAEGYDPFKPTGDNLLPLHSMDILIGCAKGHKWFEGVNFDIDGSPKQHRVGTLWPAPRQP